MRVKPIAAGDSLIWTAVAPAVVGDLAEAIFEVAAERSDRGATVNGAVSSIDLATRTVTIGLPLGALSVGLWQVQVRATGADLAITFVLDACIDVVRSLLPLPTLQERGILLLPRMGLSAAGHGLRPAANVSMRLPEMGAATNGLGMRSDAVVGFILLPMGVSALGSAGVPGGDADVRLPPMAFDVTGSMPFYGTADVAMGVLGASGEGLGFQPLGVADAALPMLRSDASGAGGLDAGVADVRILTLAIGSSGVGLTVQSDVTVRFAGVGVDGTGGFLAQGNITARLPSLTIPATGTFLPQANVTTRLSPLDAPALGAGLRAQADVTARIPSLGASAVGVVPVPQSTVLGWSDDAPLLGWADDAPLELEDA